MHVLPVEQKEKEKEYGSLGRQILESMLPMSILYFYCAVDLSLQRVRPTGDPGAASQSQAVRSALVFSRNMKRGCDISVCVFCKYTLFFFASILCCRAIYCFRKKKSRASY